MNTNSQTLHWVAVGKISDAAEREVIRMGGQVVYCAAEPPVTLVGIAYAGKRDLTFAQTSEIEIETSETGLHLVWLSSEPITNAAYSSLTDTELITYAEYDDLLTAHNVATLEEMRAQGVNVDEALGDLDDHPF